VPSPAAASVGHPSSAGDASARQRLAAGRRSPAVLEIPFTIIDRSGPPRPALSPPGRTWHTDCSNHPDDGFPTEDGVAFNIDGYLGSSVPALKVGADRTELIARNLANADTPNYKARDLDFRDALAAASGSSGAGGTLAMSATNPAHLGSAATNASSDPEERSDLKYRVPLAPALDGNTVDPQLEQAAFAETTVRFQSTLTFLNAKFHSLMTAITGS
jgi:flagellar basal-body rod protein FlgB